MTLLAEASLDLLEIGKAIGGVGAPALLGLAVYVLWTKREAAALAHAAEVKALRDACTVDVRREREAGDVKLASAQDKLDTFQEAALREQRALLADLTRPTRGAP